MPVFFKNCIFKRVQFFNQGPVYIVKWHITSPVYRQFVNALKIIIYDNIVCFCLQTLTMYVKLNII